MSKYSELFCSECGKTIGATTESYFPYIICLECEEKEREEREE